jgi:Tol biopolymer transport system component
VSVKDGQPQGQPEILLNDTGRLAPLGVTAAGTTYFAYDRVGTARTTITTIEPSASGNRQYETLVGDHPAWSPDGKLIALARPRLDSLPGSDVVIRDVTSGREDRLSLSRTSGRVRWFPDGRHLLLLMWDPDQLKTPSQSWYRVDRTSLSTERVASYRTERDAWGLAGSASLDPAGRSLYLAGYVYPSQSLDRVFVVDLSVNRHRPIFQRPQRDSERPAAGSEQVALAVSPDNRQLAMSYIDFASATIRVATLGIDGQGFTEIARAPRPATLAKQLSWSEDGKWIYFSTRPGDNSTSRHRIVKVSRDGGPVQDLGLEVDGLTGFAISSDGSHIAYSTASSEPASSVVLALELNALISGRR